jgi:pimeloyl-ACP methyl ester carboxylesterase
MSTPFATGRALAQAADGGAARIGSLQVDGRRVATYQWDAARAAPKMLLVHGWSSFALRFLPWVQPLHDAGYAVVGFDQPGHGRSDVGPCTVVRFVRTLRAVAERHGPFDAIVAHSMGGLAAALALADGLPARRVVLIAPVADPDAATMRFAHAVGVVDGLVPRIQHCLEVQTGVGVGELAVHLRVRALGTPALILHDVGDREVPWAEGESYARHWPDARLLSTSGLGHNHIVNAPATIDAGLRFLGGERIGERVVSSPNLPFGVV